MQLATWCVGARKLLLRANLLILRSSVGAVPASYLFTHITLGTNSFCGVLVNNGTSVRRQLWCTLNGGNVYCPFAFYVSCCSVRTLDS